MGREIERKYLVSNDLWKSDVQRSAYYRQGYLCTIKGGASVRVRISNDNAWLNIKGATVGVERAEYEYEISVAEAGEMLDNLCQGVVIEKTRHFVPCGDHTWELDVFEGDNKGLVVAEIELDDVDAAFELPKWVGTEVTEDSRYYNASLVKRPFRVW